jgi:diguanylate cyclase (GGDEF)-like protein
LTGLGNRRALLADLEAAQPGSATEHVLLALFDLDGFKQYNDSFGHAAGDSLLARLGDRLATAIAERGTAYRIGGDEFCIVASVDAPSADALGNLAATALCESGEGFTIGCSYGLALLPGDTTRPEVALLLADQRMYEQKRSGRASAGRQSADVLLKLLEERSSDLGQHTSEVAMLAWLTAERFDLPLDERQRIRLAAELHDIGKAAIPDAILNKPGSLDEDEWAFIRRHPGIGERIVRAAPSLAHAADLVRCHHEWYDGTGYPDGLARDAIPLGARIIAVCDAFAAMIKDRPYRSRLSVEEALGELVHCAGTQFDPRMVEAFVAAYANHAVPGTAAA